MARICRLLLTFVPFTAASLQSLNVCAEVAAFTYQGRLKSGGTSCDGLYDFQFRLYDAPTNGSQVGPLLHTASVPVENGLFAVTLDFGEAAFTGAARWLHIGVQTNGAARFALLSPRQAVTPVPCALRAVAAGVAGHATTAGGVVGSNLTASADDRLWLSARALVVQSEQMTNTVTGSARQTIGLDSEQVVERQLRVSVGGAHDLTVGGNVTAKLAKDISVQAGGGLAATLAKGISVHAQGGCDLTAQENITLDAGYGLAFTSGKSAAIRAGTSLEASADTQLTLRSGDASILMEKNGDIAIQGNKIKIQGSGDIVIRGEKTVMQGNGMLTARTNSSATFRSVASETNSIVVGIAGESAARGGIGVLGIATSEDAGDVHVGVLAVADGGDRRLALLANCVTNELLPATAVPRPAALAGRAREKQDILQGYGHDNNLCFRVAESGSVYAANTAVQPVDLAERVPVSETVVAGEVVEVDPERAGSFRRTREPYSGRVVGVISTRPGYLLGHDESRSDNAARPPLALAGRVPVKVTLEAGAIQPGDPLASASTPGCAMKAIEPWRGGVIGTALEAFDGASGETGSVEMLVRMSPAVGPNAALASLYSKLAAQEARIEAMEKALVRLTAQH